MSSVTFLNTMLYKVDQNRLFDFRKEDRIKMTIQSSSLKKTRDLNVSDLQFEEELISRAQSGDKEAFRELFENNYNRVFSAAIRMLGNKEDAADLAQEAFLKAYQNLKSFKGNSSFYTWVYRILFNASIDLRRKSSRKNEISSAEEYLFEGEGSDPLSAPFHSQQLPTDEKVYSQELKKIIGASLSMLSAPHRQIIVSREVDGMSYDEIAKILNCSVGTVMSRLFHARKNLVNILNAKLNDSSNLKSTDAKSVVDNLNV
jgi:RNA polymerase sigma-70 factor (ECF subfamily)